jgi:hypothetical protein
LSWDFNAYWFVSFGGFDRRQPEHRRNKNAVGATVPLTGAAACCSSPMAGAAAPDPVPVVGTPANPGRSELTGCAYPAAIDHP